MLTLVTPGIILLHVNDKCEFSNYLEEKENNALSALTNDIKHCGYLNAK